MLSSLIDAAVEEEWIESEIRLDNRNFYRSFRRVVRTLINYYYTDPRSGVCKQAT